MPDLSKGSLITKSPQLLKEKRRKTFLVIASLVFVASALILVQIFLKSRKDFGGVIQEDGSRESSYDLERNKKEKIEDVIIENFNQEEIDLNVWFVWTNNKARAKASLVKGEAMLEILSGATKLSAVALSTKKMAQGNIKAYVSVRMDRGSEGSFAYFILHDEKEGWPNRLQIAFNKKSDGTIRATAQKVVNGETTSLGFKDFGSGILKAEILRTRERAVMLINKEIIAQEERGFYRGDVWTAISMESYEPLFPAALCTFDNLTVIMLK